MGRRLRFFLLVGATTSIQLVAALSIDGTVSAKGVIHPADLAVMKTIDTSRVTAAHNPAMLSQVYVFHPNEAPVAATTAAAARPLVAGEYRVRRMSASPATVKRTANGLVWDVPIEIQARDITGTPHQCIPRIQLVGEGLEWNRTRAEYAGHLQVWLADVENPSLHYDLERAIPLEMSGGATKYDPADWTVGHTGVESKDVAVTVSGMHAAGSVEVRVVAAEFEGGNVNVANDATLLVPLRGDPLRIDPRTQSVVGWGLEGADFTITAPSTGVATGVAVSVRHGSPRSQQVAIGPDGIAYVRLEGQGTDSVLVNYENTQFTYAVLTYAAPWSFLAWVICGGLLGCLIRMPPEGGAKKAQPLGRRVVASVVVGVAVGILATGLYEFGFPVLPKLATGQSGGLVAAVVAAVFAFLGRDALGCVLGGAKES